MPYSQEFKDEFNLKAFKVLSNMLPEDYGDAVPIEKAEENQKALQAEWFKTLPEGKLFDTVADALIEFQRYVSSTRIKYGQSRSEYVEMSVQIDYGQQGGVITWRLGSQFDINTPNDRLNAQHNLYQAITQMKSGFERSTMLRVRGDDAPRNQDVNTFEEIKCSKLTVEAKDGKLTFKIKGGKFEKFGVRVFPDVLKAANIDPEKIPLVGCDMSAYSMTILMKGRNPDKVTKLVKVG